MRAPRLAMIALFLFGLSPAVWAVDEGQTRPRFNENFLSSSNTSIDIIATTNGSGNVKGVHCLFQSGAPVRINFYVNGGAAQAINLGSHEFPTDFNGAIFSGWIPLNIRFSTSIRVQMQRDGSPVSSADIQCSVSWALD